jgi:hypothetical protein
MISTATKQLITEFTILNNNLMDSNNKNIESFNMDFNEGLICVLYRRKNKEMINAIEMLEDENIFYTLEKSATINKKKFNMLFVNFKKPKIQIEI